MFGAGSKFKIISFLCFVHHLSTVMVKCRLQVISKPFNLFIFHTASQVVEFDLTWKTQCFVEVHILVCLDITHLLQPNNIKPIMPAHTFSARGKFSSYKFSRESKQSQSDKSLCKQNMKSLLQSRTEPLRVLLILEQSSHGDMSLRSILDKS